MAENEKKEEEKLVKVTKKGDRIPPEELSARFPARQISNGIEQKVPKRQVIGR